jgi:uncharacterized protein
MCVGCRVREDKADLLRVVASAGLLLPDPLAQLPGRGAYLHPDPGCLDTADRRRAFARALRVPGPLDNGAVRAYVEEHTAPTRSSHEQGSGSDVDERSMSTST